MSYEPSVVAAIKRSIQRKKASPRVAKALTLSGLVESDLNQTKYSQPGSGDRDSVGFLQQRPSQGWGPAGESAETDADQFIDHAIAANRGFHGSAGQLAQLVQRSAFPGKYDERSAEADKILKGILGSTQVPRSSNVSLNASMLGASSGTSPATPKAPTVYDVIRQYDAATSGEATDPSQSLDDQLQASQQMLMEAINRKNQPQPTSEPSPSLGAIPTPAPRGKGKVVIAPTANRAGAKMDKSILGFLDDLSTHAGPITVGTGTNHNRMTTDGNVSDHWDGHAADLPQKVDSKEGDLVAAHALETAGIPWSKAIQMAQDGGLFNVTPTTGPYKGHRIQVIWKTNQGGNHHNHVHVGIR